MNIETYEKFIIAEPTQAGYFKNETGLDLEFDMTYSHEHDAIIITVRKK
jgi:hypothetical protein